MTDPTPTLDEQLEQLHGADVEAPGQMSAHPVENPVDSVPPIELRGDDVATVLAALRSWHRSPDSRLHRRALELADRIDGGTR